MSVNKLKYTYYLYLCMLSLVKFTDQAQTAEKGSKTTKTIADLAFPAIYHAAGNISIPSAGITEPFEIWYAGKYNRSRIDYYNGTVQTYQRSDIGKYGTLFEVFPKYDYRHDKHYRGCWKKKGNMKKKIEPQGILPKKVYWPFAMEISQYKYMGKELVSGKMCSKWVAQIYAYNRTDTYTFHASDEYQPKPVKLEMQGYDVLLVSYYDHYIVDYTTFEEWKYDENVFNTPKVAKRDRWCQNVPKSTGEAGYRSLNPMGDFMDEENYNNFESKFNKYKKEFKKTYHKVEEHRRRMNIARHNMRYIHSMNRKQLGFKLNVNHFADLSDDEYGTHRGLSFDTLEETEEFEKHIPVLSLDDSEMRFVYNQPVGYKERNKEDLHPVSSSSKDRTEDESELGKLKARCEKGSDCNIAVINNIEDITEGSAYIPEQSERVSKTIAMNSLLGDADSNLQQKSAVVSPEDSTFDQLWSPPDGKAAKPFFMFGVDKSGSFTEQPVLETYEKDYYFKDDSKFPAEFRHWNNRRKKKARQDFGKKAQEQIPENLDWREYGAVSPIQSQGICGSCWSFSTTAAVESAHFLKTRKLKKLSEQHLIDCTWYVPHSKDGNHACMGGWTWKSFAYIKKFGIATTESYGKYVGMESSCKTRNITEGATIDSFMKVKANDAKALKRAIAIYGPATASINTETKTLKFYSSGVYNDRECTGNTDHSVLIVGYGEKDGKLYWIVRNSWGTAWGKKGYIKIENGKCGLLKKPWVIINRHRQPLPWTREAAS